MVGSTLLGGLWHGASWTFVLWGLLHGLVLAGERRGLVPTTWLPRPLGVLWTFLLVNIGWVFFRATTLGDALVILGGMFYPTEGYVLPGTEVLAAIAAIVALVFGMLLAARPDPWRFGRRLPEPVLGFGLGALFLLIQLLWPDRSAAFIYFQF